jgi:hypothetical protein
MGGHIDRHRTRVDPPKPIWPVHQPPRSFQRGNGTFRRVYVSLGRYLERRSVS